MLRSMRWYLTVILLCISLVLVFLGVFLVPTGHLYTENLKSENISIELNI